MRHMLVSIHTSRFREVKPELADQVAALGQVSIHTSRFREVKRFG